MITRFAISLFAALLLAGCDGDQQTATAPKAQPATSALAKLDAARTPTSDLAETILARTCPALERMAEAGEIESISHKIGVPEGRTLQHMGWKRSAAIEVVAAERVDSIRTRPPIDGNHCFFDLGNGQIVVTKRACAAVCDAEVGGDYLAHLPADTSALGLPQVHLIAIPEAKVAALDIDDLVRTMELGRSQIEHRYGGAVRRYWPTNIGGNKNHIEIIGKNLHDADTIAWACVQSDTNSDVDPARSGSPCRAYLAKVLGILVQNPDAVANELLEKAAEVSVTEVGMQVGPFEVQTDGHFYFVRRPDGA